MVFAKTHSQNIKTEGSPYLRQIPSTTILCPVWLLRRGREELSLAVE